MEKAKHPTPRRITKLIVEEVSLVDRAANGESFLLYKRDGSQLAAVAVGSADAAPESIGLERLPELAKFVPPAESADGTRYPYDSGAVLRMLGSIGQPGQK